MFQLLFYLPLIYAFDVSDVNLVSNTVPRLFMGSVSLKTSAYFAGGITTEKLVSNIIDIYNSETNLWTNNLLNRNAYYLTCSSLDEQNLVFFAGGISQDSSCSNSIDILNVVTSVWSNKNLTQSRYFKHSTSPSLSGFVFFAGGYDCQGNSINSMDIYDYQTGSIIKKDFPISMLEIRGEKISNDIIAFAGVNETNSFVLLYNFTNSNWIYLREIPYRYHLSTIGIPEYGLLIVAGGKNGDVYSSRIDIYDIKKNIWSNVSLSEGRTFIGIAKLVEQKLVYFSGGISKTKNGIEEFSNIVDILNFTSLFMKQNLIQYGRYRLQGISFQNFTLFFGGYPITQQAIAFSYCPAGKYGPVNNFCQICPKGYFAFFGSIKCSICPLGSYCPYLGTEFPLSSPAGWYIPITGTSQELYSMCLPGFYCPIGSSSPIICPVGSYCDQPMLEKPIECPAGTYNSQQQKELISDCIICPAGSYCNKVIGATGFIPCPPGKYCEEKSTNYNISCPQGNYCPLGTNNLIICPKGSYCPEGSSIPVACLSGYYCPEGSSTQIQCPGGYQCPSSSFEPTMCKAGFYSEAGTGVCDRCPQGQYNHKPGLSYCKVCEANLFNIISVWECMKESERTVFILSWIVTVISGVFTAKGIYRYMKRRYERLKYNGIPVNIMNLIFLGRAVRMCKKNSIHLMTKDESNKNTPLINPSDNLIIDKNGKINWDNYKIEAYYNECIYKILFTAAFDFH